MKVRRKPVAQYEADFPVEKFIGYNGYGKHASLGPGEFRDLTNWEIFSDEQGQDYLQSRRGCQFLRPETAPTKWGATDVVGAITWDVGDEEYLIAQTGTQFYSQALLDPGNPVLIAAVGGGAFAVSDTTPADMFLNGDRLFIFHPGGNKVIQFDDGTSTFQGRSMGMTAPVFSAVSSGTSGAMTGRWVYGIEKVYQVSGVDILASTPNRKTTGRIILTTGSIASKRVTLQIQATELDNDSLWTHLRLWRSKSLDNDFTTFGPLNPIDAQGAEDELYEVALITRAEMAAGALTSIATGTSLPAGNAGVKAGKPASVYTLEDNNLDTVLFDLVDLDRIELQPLPPASVGVFHGGKIWVSQVNDTDLDFRSRNNLYYSLWAGTKYSEQYDPQAFVQTGRDGQKTMRLGSLDRDLIILKEGRTCRLPAGNPDNPVEVLDPRIGINHATHAVFIPGVGVCALTTDNGDFRVLDAGLRWQSTLNGIDVSRPIRNLTGGYTGAAPMTYHNGKLFLGFGTQTGAVLFVQAKRGWGLYYYPTKFPRFMFTFANGTRAAIVAASSYLLEVEVEGLDTDDSAYDDSLANPITLSLTTHRFQSGKGRHIVEMEWLSAVADLSDFMYATPYMNGKAWPNPLIPTETAFTIDPTAYEDGSELRHREYRLYLPPATVGPFLWNRFLGNYLHFELDTVAPAVLMHHQLHAIVDEDGMSFGDYDPFQSFTTDVATPDFAASLIDGGVDDETITDEIDGGVDDETITDDIDGGAA